LPERSFADEVGHLLDLRREKKFWEMDAC
jgi:hypothetical protein